MQRIPTAELLDFDAGTPQEVASSLADLRFINRTFGGQSTTRSMVEVVAQSTGARELSLLEVAAGSGDVPRAASKTLADRGIRHQLLRGQVSGSPVRVVIVAFMARRGPEVGRRQICAL